MSGWRQATASRHPGGRSSASRQASEGNERATVRALPLFLGVLLVTSAVNTQTPAPDAHRAKLAL